MIKYTDNFAENLKVLRKRKRLSQDKLAEKLNLSRSLIGMLESGQRKPSFETLEIIADFFNVKIDDLSGRNCTNENIEDYYDAPDDMRYDFTLLCEDDSMINARIYDGDIVYIKEQSHLENGEIAACIIDGEFETKAILKRYYKYDDKIILQADNPSYPPFVYVNEEMNKVRVIGKAIGFTSKL